MKKILLLVLWLNVLIYSAVSQNVATFEMRYITSDPKANGETDFHGETEWMNLDQRVEFLNKYASYASSFFGDPRLDTKIVKDTEVDQKIKEIKPQPLTNVRQTIRLSEWQAYGHRTGKSEDKRKEQAQWLSSKDATIRDGCLVLNNCTVEKSIEELKWRFRLKVSLKKFKSDCSIILGNDNGSIISVNLANNVFKSESGKVKTTGRYSENDLINIEIYRDLANNCFYTTVDGKTIETRIENATAKNIDKISFVSKGETAIDDILLFNFVEDRENKHTPYYSSLVIDEIFEEVIPINGWQALNYDDSKWTKVNLPSVHGGLREKDESYYLRKTVKINDYERAILKLETLDPGGEVWINNQPVAIINDRHPYDLEVTKYLKPNSDNIIAVRVNPHKINIPMLHSASDHYIGWFLGRTELVLTNKCMIKDVFINTAGIGEIAEQRNKVVVQYSGVYHFEGSIEVNYYPWLPVDGEKVASVKKNVHIRPSVENNFEIELPIKNPKLWSTNTPNLYRVEVILYDKEGKTVDDYMTTTGIRTIEQKNGNLYINNKPNMLNGAQIMGCRYPVETVAKTNRCVPDETVIQDLLMIKKMNGNMLRIHVHAEKDTIDGINDPRYAEYADQLGVFLLWQTAGWIREGEAWNVDFEGYPQYMKQVYNHPSIVMWEASNHPNRFKKHDVSDSQDYMTKIYQTIASVDTSRLISPTSFWQHTHYGNYKGTIDYKGNTIVPTPVLMEKMMTRGSQDAYTGYGTKWTSLRKAPNKWAASCLEAKDKAYFNFEHEESAAQPNWALARKEPWFEVQSYEWEYEKGSIGRQLDAAEWRASQAFQAFSAWESMKKQILLGYDGFSWCSLESGSNMFTYQKPLVDPFGVPKLAFHTNKMVFNTIWAASDNVDVVYGPGDTITPVIFNIGDKRNIDLTIELQNEKGKSVDRKIIRNIEVDGGRTIIKLDDFKFKRVPDGYYFIVYSIK